MERRDFLSKLGMATVSYTLVSGKVFGESDYFHFEKIEVPSPIVGEDLFQYIQRQKGSFDVTLYRQLLGAANDKFTHSKLHTRGDHKLFWLILLEHQPLHTHIVFSMAPISQGIDITHVKTLLKALCNVG